MSKVKDTELATVQLTDWTYNTKKFIESSNLTNVFRVVRATRYNLKVTRIRKHGMKSTKTRRQGENHAQCKMQMIDTKALQNKKMDWIHDMDDWTVQQQKQENKRL